MNAKVILAAVTGFLCLFLDAAHAANEIAGFESALDFAQAARHGIGKELAGKEIVFRLRDLRLQQQVFRKVKRKRDWRQFLYFSRAAYDDARGELCFDVTVYRWAASRGGWGLSCPFAVKTDRATAKRVIQAADLYALEILLSGTPAALRAEDPKSEDRRLELKQANAKLLVDGKDLVSATARSIRKTEVPGKTAALQTGKSKVKEEVVLDLEAENVSSLILYADWERDETGWYARELTRGGSGLGIAVCHIKNRGAVMTHEFADPLPPGRYRVLLQPHYASARDGVFAVEVSLGDTSRRIAWFYASRSGIWASGLSIEIKKPATRLSVKALKSGGGGTGSAPELREKTIMLDRIRVVRMKEVGEDLP